MADDPLADAAAGDAAVTDQVTSADLPAVRDLGARVVTESVAIAEISPAAYNPREDLQPGDPRYEALERSLDRWGVVQPLVWNRRSGNLVGGHQRFKILRARGLTHVDVIVVDLPDHEERALNVALNKIEGDWDWTKLGDLLSGLALTDVDLFATGFSAGELAQLTADLTAFTPAEAPLPDTAPVRPSDVAAAADAVDQRFGPGGTGGSKPIMDVTCPQCGHEFGV